MLTAGTQLHQSPASIAELASLSAGCCVEGHVGIDQGEGKLLLFLVTAGWSLCYERRCRRLLY
jgi:hypothetical protein